MNKVSINIDTAVSLPTVFVENKNPKVTIESEITNNNFNINSLSNVNNNLIDVSLKERNTIFIDVEKGAFYGANSNQRGISKLYNLLGLNVDGAVDQKTISENINLKVDKILGYSLSKNDLTNNLKISYDNAVSWILSNGATLISHLTSSVNPHGVTKSQVGLSEVTNTDFTSAVSLNTEKIGYNELLVSSNESVVQNTNKTGITNNQSNNIILNTNKTGITESQADEIILNTNKISYTNFLNNLKVDKIDDYELVGVSHLIHRSNMSIRQCSNNIKLILK
tara:strand:- start:2355 stop:3197 length:843 start_codon:yes stop_codon:yes gene_type:complete